MTTDLLRERDKYKARSLVLANELGKAQLRIRRLEVGVEEIQTLLGDPGVGDEYPSFTELSMAQEVLSRLIETRAVAWPR